MIWYMCHCIFVILCELDILGIFYHLNRCLMILDTYAINLIHIKLCFNVKIMYMFYELIVTANNLVTSWTWVIDYRFHINNLQTNKETFLLIFVSYLHRIFIPSIQKKSTAIDVSLMILLDNNARWIMIT